MVNVITQTGYLGKDPESFKAGTHDGAKFSIGVYGGKDKPTTWFSCSIIGARAKTVLQYLKKGDRTTVTGALEVNATEKETYLNIKLSDFDLPPKPKTVQDVQAPLDDSLPF